jgi:hypothetical protein
MLAMLDEHYILTLPRLKRETAIVEDSSPARLHWLWLTWRAKILGWRQKCREGDAWGFSAEVHDMLRQSVYPFLKLERDGGRRIAEPPTPYCTYTVTEELWLNLESRPSTTTKKGWEEFMQAKGYLDLNNCIVWAADPATHLSTYSFKYLVAVAGANVEDVTRAPCCIPCSTAAMAGGPRDITVLHQSDSNSAGLAGHIAGSGILAAPKRAAINAK